MLTGANCSDHGTSMQGECDRVTAEVEHVSGQVVWLRRAFEDSVAECERLKGVEVERDEAWAKLETAVGFAQEAINGAEDSSAWHGTNWGKEFHGRWRAFIKDFAPTEPDSEEMNP